MEGEGLTERGGARNGRKLEGAGDGEALGGAMNGEGDGAGDGVGACRRL